MRKMKNIVFAVLIAVFVLFCFFRADSVKSAVSDALARCLTIIIPSLYAMMIISCLLVKSNIASSGRILCGIFSMLAGYPVGAKILCSQYDSGNIGKKDAELLSSVFFGAGGAFIFGCTAYGGGLILASNILANAVISAVLLFYFRKNPLPENQRKKPCFSAEMLMDSVNSAGRSMAEICFAVLAFAVVTAVLRDFSVLSALSALLSRVGFSQEISEKIICSVIDVTAVNDLTKENINLIPVASGLVSFGGLCVFLQISAIFRGKLSVFPLICFRITAGILSGLICRLLLPFFISDETVAVSLINTHLHKSPSPVPSILLIIMTAVLFCEYEKNFRKSSKNS
ncbi:MAG: hypothetical protein NC340_03795 [Ruminococcus flavefaciens]|nr:hypothetical protein [Ruminococcus flavefaciens]MCM1229173.1 hypothetical protein [Ruminococcus flavefaciens]